MIGNDIVIERPWHGCSEGLSLDYINAFRVFVPFDSKRAACFTVYNSAGYWDGFQVHESAVGIPRQCVAYYPGDASFSSVGTGTNWAAYTFTGTGCRYMRHLNGYKETLRWTAPDDYEQVLVVSRSDAAWTDMDVTVTGSGTRVLATLDCTSGSSPWAITGSPTYSRMICTPQYVVVATNVKAGDTIDFTCQNNTVNAYIGTIYGVNKTVHVTGTADLAFTDALLLNNNLYASSETAYMDSNVIDIQNKEDFKGDVLAMVLTTTAHGTPFFWGSPAHRPLAADMLTGAGGSGKPTATFKYFDDSNDEASGGATWSPSVGDRTACHGLLVTVTGEVNVYGTQCGTWRHVMRFDKTGFSEFWEIIWNANAVTDGVVVHPKGYNSMLLFGDPGPAYVKPLPGSAEIPLVKDIDGYFTGFSWADSGLFWGGCLGDVEVEVYGTQTYPWVKGQWFCEERASGDVKWYKRCGIDGQTEHTVANGDRTKGGKQVYVRKATPSGKAVIM